MNDRSIPAGPSFETPPSLETIAASPRGWWKMVLCSAPVRIIGGFVFVVGSTALAASAVHWLLVHSPRAASQDWQPPVINLAVLCTALAAYVLFVRWTEGRRYPAELSAAGAPLEWVGGAGLGTGMFSLTALLLWMAGAYRMGGMTSVYSMELIQILVGALVAAFVEEILFRGLLFRLTAQSLGRAWAILVSAAFFGLVHLANPHANWWAGLAIALEAGVLLAAAYLTTRRLWFPIGAHFGWNFTQGGIFGGAISGNVVSGLLRGELHGPTWLSGGAFGAEASVAAVLVCCGVAWLLLWRESRRHPVTPVAGTSFYS